MNLLEIRTEESESQLGPSAKDAAASNADEQGPALHQIKTSFRASMQYKCTFLFLNSTQTSNGAKFVVLERDAGRARLRATIAVRCAVLETRFEIILR